MAPVVACHSPGNEPSYPSITFLLILLSLSVFSTETVFQTNYFCSNINLNLSNYVLTSVSLFQCLDRGAAPACRLFCRQLSSRWEPRLVPTFATASTRYPSTSSVGCLISTTPTRSLRWRRRRPWLRKIWWRHRLLPVIRSKVKATYYPCTTTARFRCPVTFPDATISSQRRMCCYRMLRRHLPAEYRIPDTP